MGEKTMTIETVYLMTDNGRFVCTDGGFGQVRIEKDRADATCKLRAGYGPGDGTVIFYNAETNRYWAVAPDITTPHVDDLVTAKKQTWTAFSYDFVGTDQTLMTLRHGDDSYVTRVDIGRPHELLAASGTSAEEASRFRVIRFADEA